MANKKVLSGHAVVTYENTIPPFKRSEIGEINVEVSQEGDRLWICKDGQSLIRIKILPKGFKEPQFGKPE